MSNEARRHETLIVRRRGYRWALAAAYLSMLLILSVTFTGLGIFQNGATQWVATRSIK